MLRAISAGRYSTIKMESGISIDTPNSVKAKGAKQDYFISS